MLKIIPMGSQDQMLMGQPQVQLVKLASTGLNGEDLRSFIKRAGHSVADQIRNLEFKPGEVPVHTIAIGASEWFGMNRNGDGFKEATCKQYHKTFEKYGRLYRDHLNKDPEKSYGIVKLAIYNEPMHRIELVNAYNGTKAAAERNGGYVADKELAELEKSGTLAGSMSCTVPYDVCSVCGNRAKTRADYCTGVDEGGSCPGGGLRTKIATVLADGTPVFADNPEARWFDWSSVWRPAERTAYASGIVPSDMYRKS
jgi:hypothetical protein